MPATIRAARKSAATAKNRTAQAAPGKSNRMAVFHMGSAFKRELIVYEHVLRDKRTPVVAKLFLGLAIGYLLMPFDLIPDFIPVIGHLDDVVILPALVFVALRCIPRQIVSEHREQVAREDKATMSAPTYGWPLGNLRN